MANQLRRKLRGRKIHFKLLSIWIVSLHAFATFCPPVSNCIQICRPFCSSLVQSKNTLIQRLKTSLQTLLYLHGCGTAIFRDNAYIIYCFQMWRLRSIRLVLELFNRVRRSEATVSDVSSRKIDVLAHIFLFPHWSTNA